MIEGLGTKLKVRGMAASSPRSKAHCTRERELATPSSVVPNPPPGWSGNELEDTRNDFKPGACTEIVFCYSVDYKV